ncbi:MAG: enoyl-CoA hydratase [Myxococcales bacterium]|nr:enoyl-CoA hydratase [Myxococcales bacterium]
MAAAGGELVLVERPAEGVARVVMNRPERRNALDLALARALREALEDASADDTVRAVILAGAGPTFSAGGDVKMMAEAGSAGREPLLLDVTRHFHAAVAEIAAMQKPVIAAVQGGAGGGGLSLMCACDLVIVDEKAKLVFAFNALGLTPDGGSSHHLPQMIGWRRATEMAFLNEPLDGRRAVDLGLATRAVPTDQVAEEALALATRLAAGPTAVFGKTKELLRAMRPLAETLAIESTTIAAASAEVDGGEGIDAFIEKRAPRFRGR